MNGIGKQRKRIEADVQVFGSDSCSATRAYLNIGDTLTTGVSVG